MENKNKLSDELLIYALWIIIIIITLIKIKKITWVLEVGIYLKRVIKGEEYRIK